MSVVLYLEISFLARSAILSCPFGQYSRLPRQAKKVLIPVVPQLNKPKEDQEEKDEEEALFGDNHIGNGHENGSERVTPNGKAPKAEAEEANSDDEVPPPKSVDDLTSMVSSIVIATEENGIMLDFSEPGQPDSLGNSAPSSCSSSSDTARSDTSLLSRVRDRTASMKRSLTPTLRRKRSVTSTDTLSTTATECDAASSACSTPTKPNGLPRVSPNRILKPGCPPPPPPSRPNAPPPPPPPSSQNGQTQSNSNLQEAQSQMPQVPKAAPTRSRVAPPAPPTRAPTTKISASIENILAADHVDSKENYEVTENGAKKEEIPRTGFDFLDNW